MKCIPFMFESFSRWLRPWALEWRLGFYGRISQGRSRAAGEPPPNPGGAAEDGLPAGDDDRDTLP